jgi:tRNA(Arg) A34 adenosine deaminase TadA
MSKNTDEEFLRQATALAESAVAGGGRPFDAIVADRDRRTAHSEMQALRAASAALPWDAL